jgi:hypothetical protein
MRVSSKGVPPMSLEMRVPQISFFNGFLQWVSLNNLEIFLSINSFSIGFSTY